MVDEEPPALSSSAAPPPSAFSSSGNGGPPPASAFAHPGNNSTNAARSNNRNSATASDLNSRWKQYETSMNSNSNNNNSSNSNNSSSNKKEAHENYDLYESPEKFGRSASTAGRGSLSGSSRKLYSGNDAVANSSSSSNNNTTSTNTAANNLAESLEPRRTYSFTKSSSYDTNALIAKYAGVSGVSRAPPSVGLQRTLSSSDARGKNSSSSSSTGNGNNRNSINANANANHSETTSVLPSTARAEAMQVLSMADERVPVNTNQPFQVRRTESGGFRALAVDPSETTTSASTNGASYSFQRSNSNSNSNNRRTPAALSGLGLGASSSGSKPDWKAGRYSFRDPQFREDDYLAEEEDDILGPAASVSEEFHDEVDLHTTSNGAFEGDFPGTNENPNARPSSSWSSRYSDNPKITNGHLLDRYDRSHAAAQQQPGGGRQSARKMFMSTANNVGDSVRTFGGNVSNRLSEAKANIKDSAKNNANGTLGKGFSFKAKRNKQKQKQKQDTSHRLPGSPQRPAASSATGSTNLRTIWKDSDSNDDDDVDDYNDDGLMDGSGKQHKTWEQVMREKKRRRTVGLSVLCALVAVIIVAVSVSQTSWRWKYKNLWGSDNNHLEVTFYATSNTPLGYGTNEDQLVQDLVNLPIDADFVAHLGNLQDASVNMCPASRMPEMASLLHAKVPVPLFVVPGEHDWIRCPNQLTALARWMNAFATTPLEELAASDDDYTAGPAIAALQALDFDRPKTSPELFSKLHNGVLVIGLHLVRGTVTEGAGTKEQVVRDEKMTMFVKGTLDRLAGQYRAVVMLGNARPGPGQRAFFGSISEDLAASRVPIAYVHANSGRSSNNAQYRHYPFGEKKQKGDGLSGMVAIEAPSGGNNQPPLRITVGFGKKMFRVG